MPREVGCPWRSGREPGRRTGAPSSPGPVCCGVARAPGFTQDPHTHTVWEASACVGLPGGRRAKPTLGNRLLYQTVLQLGHQGTLAGS